MKKEFPEKYGESQQKAKEYSKLYRLQCVTAKKNLEKRNLKLTERAELEKWAKRLQRKNEAVRRMNEVNKRKQAERISNNKMPKK